MDNITDMIGGGPFFLNKQYKLKNFDKLTRTLLGNLVLETLRSKVVTQHIFNFQFLEHLILLTQAKFFTMISS